MENQVKAVLAIYFTAQEFIELIVKTEDWIFRPEK